MILLRSAVFNAYFFGLTTLIGLVGLPVRAFAPHRSLALAQLWARLVLAGARRICGIDAQVTGDLPTGAALIASQHQSAFDTLVWVALLPKVSYVFKAELARIPLFGPLLLTAGQIPLDRRASLAAVRKLIRGAEAAKADARQIVIFPEGTRVAPGTDAQLRAGVSLLASKTGLPVIPVATDSGHYWSRRAFRKRPGTIRIHLGTPISPTLPQAELIATLKSRWHEAGLSAPPVDNLVDRISPARADGRATDR